MAAFKMYFADGIKLSCLLLCMILLVTVQTSTSSPWTDPCGGPSVVPGTEGNGGTASNVSITTALENIASSAEEASSRALILQRLYITSRGIGAHIQAALLNFPTFPNNINEITAALQRNYDDITTMIVFMEQVLNDERTSHTALNFTSDMTNLQTSLTGTLCKIKAAADVNGQNLASSVTRDVMPDFLRDMPDQISRYIRDYIVFKDASTYLTNYRKVINERVRL